MPSSIIFGPVTSRRFGISLGVDLSPKGKQCNFDCLYCELAKAKPVASMEEVVPLEEVIDAIKEGLRAHPQSTFITLTANGEPTLYPHLEALIKAIKALHVKQKILLLSNGSTIMMPHVQRAIRDVDVVKLSLDSVMPKAFQKLDRPHKGIDVAQVVEGMEAFAKTFPHTLILEILVVKGVNDTPEEFKALNAVIGRIKPARVDVGTIARPPAYGVLGVGEEELRALAALIEQVPVTVPWKATYAGVLDYTKEELLALLQKRPQSQEDVNHSFSPQSLQGLEELLEEKKVTVSTVAGMVFYRGETGVKKILQKV